MVTMLDKVAWPFLLVASCAVSGPAPARCVGDADVCACRQDSDCALTDNYTLVESADDCDYYYCCPFGPDPWAMRADQVEAAHETALATCGINHVPDCDGDDWECETQSGRAECHLGWCVDVVEVVGKSPR